MTSRMALCLAASAIVFEKNKANEPWCLLPYGNSTELAFSTKSGESTGHYICRDLNARYSFKDEFLIYIDEIYETHEQMMCMFMNNIFVSAEGNISGPYKNERMYHIRKTDDVYTIVGHLNLKLVKPVQLK